MFRSAKISHGVNVLVWMVREMSEVDRRGRVGEYEQGVARDNAVRLRQATCDCGCVLHALESACC